MTETNTLLMILGVSVASMLPRILPVTILTRYEFPPGLRKWLSYVGPSVLGALTAISILAPEAQIDISFNNIYLIAFIPTIIVAIKTRSLFITLTTGIISMALLRNIFSF